MVTDDGDGVGKKGTTVAALHVLLEKNHDVKIQLATA
jgi:hypothetical protein